jgi:hypothetical protein
MMKVECYRIRQESGSLGLKWTAKFTFSMRIPIDPVVNKLIATKLNELGRLKGVFAAFNDWVILQDDYRDEGLVSSIILTPAHKDELDNYLLGKILTELKSIYREIHPKVICQNDR